MEDEFVIFERVFRQEYADDGLFVRMTCSEDNELEYVQVKTVTFSESLGSMTPTLILDIVDGSGDLVNLNHLDTEAIFTLYYGRTMEDAAETEYKIADIQNAGDTGGRSNNVRFIITFVQRDWEDTIATKKNRGWNDVRYSDVVQNIVANKHYNELDIERSSALIPTVLQPNWDDITMMNYLQKMATPSSRDGHYEFCGDLRGRFFFKSTYELIQDGRRSYRSGNMPLLRMGGQPSREERERLTNDNERVPIGFLGFGSEEHYMSSISEGASSIESSYYDWDARQYIKRTHNYESLNSTQLSEWSMLKRGNNFTTKKMYGGRDPRISDRANNELSEVSLAMQDITINIEGTTELHCGMIVEVIIPNSFEDTEIPYNELYSGFYMVKENLSLLALHKQSDFASQITLTRHGLDSKDIRGYARSQKGRARFDV